MRRNYDSCVLATGGAGFLGSHLIDRLLSDGHEVVCVDNLFTGTKHNLERLHTNAPFEFLRHDITFPLYVEVDEIYNLACPASPVQYQHDPVQTHKNVGTRRDKYVWPRQASEVSNSAGFDKRGLWRSRGSSSNRGLLGPSESHWSSILL